MSWLSIIRFWTRGPGIVLILVGVAITIAWFVSRERDKKEAEAAKRQTQRQLGQVNPSASVDPSSAAKETVLSNRKLSPLIKVEPDAQPQNIPVSIPSQKKQLPQLISFYSQVSAPSPTPTPQERPQPEQWWLPPSMFIPCALVNTVESSHINTPVVGEVIRDCWQINNGVRHLIIPAGTIVSSFAQSGAVRDRIEVAGEWLLVFNDGKQIKISGIACVRQADPENQQFGPEDGSAGIMGQLVESDHWANAKAFLALLITSGTQVATSAASSALSRGYGGGVALPDTTGIEAKYLDQLLNGETGDGRFVRVPASTEFYIFPTETVLPLHRSIENHARDKSEDVPLAPSQDPMQALSQMQQQLMRPQQTQQDQSPKFKY
jgi:hypothetical protein